MISLILMRILSCDPTMNMIQSSSGCLEAVTNTSEKKKV